MKKAPKYMVLMSVLLGILSGCVKDDRSDCPVDEGPRLILNFEYYDYAVVRGDTQYLEMFSDSINSVDVLIFDHDLRLYSYTALGREVKTTKKTEIAIDPGDYYVVCWANNNKRDWPGQRSVFGDLSLELDRQTTIDPIYYAPEKRPAHHGQLTRSGVTRAEDLQPYLVRVAEEGTTEHTMQFMSAHRTLKVTLVNFPELADEDSLNPTVSVTNQVSHYMMDLTRGDAVMTLAAEAVSVTDTDDRQLGFYSSYIPHFENDNPIDIIINGTDGTGLPYTRKVPMTRVLEELYPDWELYDGDNRVLEVEIDWNDGVHVTLRIAKWKVKEVDPGFNN